MNKVKIKFGQIEFEVEGDSDFVEREREQFFSILPSAIAAVSPIISNFNNGLENFEVPDSYEVDTIDSVNYNDQIDSNYDTLPSLLKDKKLENNIDLVLGTVFFLDVIKGYETVSSNDISQALSEARQPKLSNVSAFINSNITKGFLLEGSEKKEGKKVFRISTDGIEYISNYVAKDKPKMKKSNSSSARNKVESKYIDVTREGLNINTYPSLSSFSKFKDKMLLAMYIFTTEGKGEYFSLNDLLYILPNIFGEGATNGQINGVFRRNITWFNKLDPSGEGKFVEYKLLNDGLIYIKDELLA